MMRLGYYGKVPERGDFIRFNLPQSLINVWDDWLQLALIHGEQTHNTRWSELYHSAPPHRFVCSRDIMGLEPWFGVFVPSSDKVGRRFPFCIIGTTTKLVSPIQGLLDFQDLLKTIENLALDLSIGALSVDSLNGQLDELTHSWIEHDSPEAPPKPMESDSFVVRSNSDKSGELKAFTNALLDSYMQQHYRQVSVFQSCPRDTASRQRQSELDTTGLFLSSGLPNPNEGLSLFTDQFDPQTSNVTFIQVIPPADSSPHINEDFSKENSQTSLEDPDIWDALQSIEEPKQPKEHAEVPENAQALTDEPAKLLEGENALSETLAAEGTVSQPSDNAKVPQQSGPIEKPTHHNENSVQLESETQDTSESSPESVLPNEAKAQPDQSKERTIPPVEKLEIAEEDLSAMPWEDN